MTGCRYWLVLCAIILIVFCLLMAASVAFGPEPGSPWGYLLVAMLALLGLRLYVKKGW